MNFPAQLVVPTQTIPVRLDKFLVSQWPKTSRAYWQKNLENRVRVDGKRARKGQWLHGGERLEFLKQEREGSKVSAPSLQKIKVVLEDPSFLVVEKPPGLSVHPLLEEEEGTLVQEVARDYPEIASVGEAKREMGLAHRLDLETSGLVLIARNEKAHAFLREEFRRRRVEKEYLALVAGKLKRVPTPEGWEKVDWPIAHHPKNRKKMIALEKEAGKRIHPKKQTGRAAITYYRVEKQFVDFTLLRVRILTGVRHQIRVHLAKHGLPLLGDSLYGGEKALSWKAPRIFLHATRLVFRHPVSLRNIEVFSPLPDDLKDFLNR